ncbi:hypothetical protein P872_25270 [Rhodonellum psychrophilum GCM71 = DSM 17998]|uniref:Gingipain domain-containing protein n=2 Tax=Rhodonellum TaxID=336827 RepID=U5BV06_9BACT|nr:MULTISPECIES: type IX secretion system sortase PorU [Rhodonellum]ERM84470.1 hypothetical protein P872_25270 [Rhodonellum psychrophilum GCM71 = DSM 17998]SDZ00870.1 Peptidase family C25 [Rhodonellum ikkaensis]
MNDLELKFRLWKIGILLLFPLAFPLISKSQTAYLKFPITKEGVYKISLSQVSSLGVGDLDEISLFGNPGMIPQKLDSLSLTLREIPTQKIGESLYFFTPGPHQIGIVEDEIQYQHHHYVDTLYYLIGKKVSSNKIALQSNPIQNPNSTRLYQINSQKWEENNILSSGRNWYSKPIFRGQSKDISFQKPIGSDSDLFLKINLMGQSLSENEFKLTANGQLTETITLPSIPNSTYGIKGREAVLKSGFSVGNANNISLNIAYQTTDLNGNGYLDYALLVSAFNTANLSAGIYYHLDENPAIFSTSGDFKVWNVSNPYQIWESQKTHVLNKGGKILIFDPTQIVDISRPEPVNMTIRENAIREPLIIITSDHLISQANRLASHKNGLGIQTKVVRLKEIYDGFGYGTKDVSAIRNFLAFHFHKEKQLKNVLFFGKGTFDYKTIVGGRPNLVPTYSSRNSLNPLTTYSSDDFFGFLDWGQGEWEESTSGDERLQIGVGRIPATNFAEATVMVDKLIAYENRVNTAGDWKRKIAFFADDADNNIHLNDAESHAAYLSENHPEFQIEKLYLDKFEQLRTSTRQFSPVAKAALSKTIEEGLLFLNYIGHGNETTLTAEQVFTVSDLANWPDNPLLPLFVTATCEFGRHDSPFVRSGAEELLFARKKGAIGLLTTGRPVFSSLNFALNKAFIEAVFNQENGEYLDLGAIYRLTKNNSLNGAFNRNFSLLGDPSMKLALPELKTKIENVFDILLDVPADTLKASQILKIEGEIIDPLSGGFLANANGIFELLITDKPSKSRTLGDESNPADFFEDTNILFKGSGNITGGTFAAEIFIPKNIDYSFGKGKIRVFAKLDRGTQEAMGAETIVIGGTSGNSTEDKEGPKIQLFFGDSTTNANTFNTTTLPLLVHLEDISGINISPNNIGQDLSLIVNGGTPIVLNYHYLALNSGYKNGKVETLLEGLREGGNIITIEAWDNVGNSSTLTREITIKGSLEIKIIKHLTYPNPATEKSHFTIEHNRPNENILLNLSVFTTGGQKIYTAQKRYVKAASILEDLEWIFLHDKTKYPAKGTYIYEIQLLSELDGSSDSMGGKIIIQ